MAIEIVDLPINSMVIFHSYVKLPEGTYYGSMFFGDPWYFNACRKNFEGSEVRFGPQVGIGHQQKYWYRKKHRTSGIDVSSLVIWSCNDSDWIGFVIIYVLVWLNNNNICGFRGVFLAMPWDKLPKSASLLPLAIGLVTISVAVGTVGTCWNSQRWGEAETQAQSGRWSVLEALPWLEAKTGLFFGFRWLRDSN